MPSLLKIDNIMYRVSDLEKARTIYAQALGLTQVWEDKDRKMIGFKFPQSDAEIVIHSDPELPEFDFSYLVENVEEFIARATQYGLIVAFGPISVRTGKYAVLEDADKNKIPVIDLTAFDGVPKYD